MSIFPKEDSIIEMDMQVLNLKYPIETGIKSSCKRKIFGNHPEQHSEIRDNPDASRKCANKAAASN